MPAVVVVVAAVMKNRPLRADDPRDWSNLRYRQSPNGSLYRSDNYGRFSCRQANNESHYLSLLHVRT